MEESTVRIGDLDSRTMLYTEFRRTGGDPSFLFELLEGIITRREWETLKDEQGNPVGSLRRLIEAPLPTGCGQTVEKLKALLVVEHHHAREDNEWAQRMKTLRTQIEAELKAKLNDNGGDRRNEDSIIYNTETPKQQGTSREYTIARLERDGFMDLAQQVIDQEITAAEARRRAGWEKRKVSVRMDDPHSAAETIVKHMPREVIDELISLLLEAIHQDS
jgi:hypothetical protein